ncbi:hydroxymethylglutaryl-CoA synthase [Mesonia phycicola]|uniref:Hydroxymethylglutaryl-CoA synthase n=1 Tax=Mesonia phycicola TaxID=579105 RepID=A0A1M6BUD9_9FLAO|nr:hydroxymethylglutaryl-CoA synthase [Mesonia phycicola]SHI52301.1 hydroxymethylglutaryl-CoA synthase [Mesonia phycicola]
MKIGIDSISFDIPKIQLPIQDLAIARNIEPAKLEKGLGLVKMTFPDVHQDVITFAANALTKLIEQEDIEPSEIHRIYVGSESGIDASKPIGSYLIGMMDNYFGEGKFTHCDAVDFTFACIGGVDAFHNCLDFVRVNPTKKAIVICTDVAKYDLNSTGEYTQGAGAVALLISKNPRLMEIENNISVSTKGVFDFFKPHRTIKKESIGIHNNEEWQGVLESEIEIFKEQPVFDGQYSNECYIERTTDAYFQFKKLKQEEETLYQTWEAIIMHLPYSFQARRMFAEIYASDNPELAKNYQKDDEEYFSKLKALSKSEEYKFFVAEKFAPAERASSLIGNMYTASMFMGMLSTLCDFYENGKDLSGKVFGFMAYGSGAKSKVFEGKIVTGSEKIIAKQNLFKTLDACKHIDIDTYHQLHKKEINTSVISPKQEWVLDSIENEKENLIGARYYKWVE